MKKSNFYLLFTISFQSFFLNAQNKLQTNIIYFLKEKDGIYILDLNTNIKEKIFSAWDGLVFSREEFQVEDSILTFGICGKLLNYITNNREYDCEQYYIDYFSVNIKTKKYWLSKRILYELNGYSTLKILKYFFNKNGFLISSTDSSAKWIRSEYANNQIVYNGFDRNYYQHTRSGKTVFSHNGNLYMSDNNDTTLLLKYNGYYSRKTGGGYICPQLSPTLDYVIFVKDSGSIKGKFYNSLWKLNLATKQVEFLKEGYVNSPKFSINGSSILFSRNQRGGKFKTVITTFYLLDLNTRKEKKIGDASYAQWGNL